MGTSESAIARLEAGEVDPRLSTIERFADALGKRLEWHHLNAPGEPDEIGRVLRHSTRATPGR